MVNDARADECVAVAVEIDSPWVASTIGEDFEFFRVRLIPRNCRRDLDTGRAGLRNFHPRMGEHAMSHVKPAIGTPGKSVEQFVTIIEAEASEQDGSSVRFVVMIRVLKEQKIRRLADINAAVAKGKTGGEVEAIGENRNFVSATIVVGVFENFDAVARLGARRSAEGIFVKYEHPQASALVPGHSDRIDDIRLGREESHFESFRNDESLLCFFGRKGQAGGGGVGSGELFAGGEREMRRENQRN